MSRDEVEGKAEVPGDVMNGIKHAWKTGAAPKEDCLATADVCGIYEHPVAMNWIRANQATYARGVKYGFTVEG